MVNMLVRILHVLLALILCTSILAQKPSDGQPPPSGCPRRTELTGGSKGIQIYPVLENEIKTDEDGELRQLLRRAAVRDLGYELVPGWLGYYKIHTDAKRWHDAHEVCAQEGAHLLVINSPQEADAVQNLVERTGTSHNYHWVGFHDQFEESQYITIFNESLKSAGYDTWGNDEPDERMGENCGVFGNFYLGTKTGFSLGDFWCEALLPFVCEITSEIQGNEGKLAPLADYILLPRLGFYKVHTEVQTWENAIATCEGEGTHLLVISTRDEEKALLPLIDKTPARGNYYWVGLHDHFSEGQYQNIRNESHPYLDWLIGQPTGKSDVNCVAFYYDPDVEYGLDDLACTDQEQFICEIEL